MGVIMKLVREYNTKQVALFGEIITVPSWSRYITIDQNGLITVFSHKPSFNRSDDGEDYWFNNDDDGESYDVDEFMLLEEIRARLSEKEDAKDFCFYIGEGKE